MEPAMGTAFLRALENYRRHEACSAPPALADRVLGAWIHHDNLLEGESFSPREIQVALAGADADFDTYLHPLFARIRRYADAIRGVWTLAGAGPSAVTLDALKRINADLNPDPADRGGLYRQTSPVHRDYFQAICAADKVPYHLRKLFEHIEAEAAKTMNPVAFAADVHHRLMFAYPFRKQPGTTARLFTNLVLLAHGYPPAILPGGLRAEYYAALDAPQPAALTRLYGGAMTSYMETATPQRAAQAPLLHAAR
jgi:hypothetical protein